jgi:hypothetical protein
MESNFVGGFADFTGQAQVVYYSSFFFACPMESNFVGGSANSTG